MRYAFILLVVMFSGICLAQPTTAPAPSNVEIVTRVYDVSDMIWRKNDYPASGAEAMPGGFAPGGQGLYGGGGGGGPGPVQPGQDRGPAGDIIHLITDTIAPDTWKDNGGTIGSMREFSGQLVVSQTAENHKLLADLFQQLREGRGRMVVVRAYWLLLDPASVPS